MTDNPLADLESIGVAPDMHDWTFEQALSLYQPPNRDVAKSVGVIMPDGQHTVFGIKSIAKLCGVSFTKTVEAALQHGYTIFLEKHGDLIIMAEANGIDAAVSDDEVFFATLSGSRVGTQGMNKLRIPVRTDESMSQHLGSLSGILCASKTTLASICVMESLTTSTLAADSVKNKFKKYVMFFDKTVEKNFKS